MKNYHICAAMLLTIVLSACGGDDSEAPLPLPSPSPSPTDVVGPALAMQADKATLRYEEEAEIQFEFSEEVLGFDAHDIITRGGRIESFRQVSEATFIATFVSESSTGAPMSVSVEIGSLTDRTGNRYAGLTLQQIIVDERPPLAYELNHQTLTYEPYTRNAYYSPGYGTVNVSNSSLTAPQMNGVPFPTDFLVQLQFSKTLAKIDRFGRIVWDHPSGGRFVTKTNKTILTNGQDVKNVDVLDIDGNRRFTMTFPKPVNYARIFEDKIAIIYTTIDPAEIYEWNSESGKGDLLFTTDATLSYGRAADLKDDVIAIADTFSHRIVVQSISTRQILDIIPAFYPNDVAWRGDFLYIAEEHHDRIIAYNVTTKRKFVVMAAPNPARWDPFMPLGSDFLQFCGDDVPLARSISSDKCSGMFTLYAMNGFALRKDGMFVADTDNSRVIYVENGMVVSALVGFNNPVKVVALEDTDM